MAILNYTTKIPVAKTAAEVQAILGGHGADDVLVRYQDRQPVAISFSLQGAHGQAAFTLPVDTHGVLEVINHQWRSGEIRVPGGGVTRDVLLSKGHAERVAWRIAKDWLEAQLALVEARMVTLEQVMLPYRHVAPDGTTLYQRYLELGAPAIDAGSAVTG